MQALLRAASVLEHVIAPGGGGGTTEVPRTTLVAGVKSVTMSAQTTAEAVQQPGAAHDPNRPYKDVSTWDLVETLKIQYSEGCSYDDAVVFEVATRAIDAEDPNAASTTF